MSEPEFPPVQSAADPSPEAARLETISANESRNLLVLAGHFIVLRISWIFKTESVIMPAFVDTIAGAGWIRGCLPVLNRFGQSVPSLLLSERLRRTKLKKWSLFLTSLLMAAPFLTISAIWFSLDEKQQVWMPIVFLALYFFFFTVNGLNQLVFGTIQGKLIRAEHRGRLMGISGTLGSVLAIGCAWLLMRQWLDHDDGGYGYIFGFTGLGFVVAGLISFGIVEPADEPGEHRNGPFNHFRDSWSILRSDAEFRRLVIAMMLFIMAQLLFPHYQALGREQPGYQPKQLMVWVIAQNAGAGLFSLVAGWVADRFGNRVVVRVQMFAASLTPLLALWLTSGDGSRASGFWITFFLLGLVPVTYRTVVNFTLELSKPADHPRYISTLKVGMAVPFVLSPLVGLLVDAFEFQAVFIAVAVMTAGGGLMTLRLSEPRETG